MGRRPCARDLPIPAPAHRRRLSPRSRTSLAHFAPAHRAKTSKRSAASCKSCVCICIYNSSFHYPEARAMSLLWGEAGRRGRGKNRSCWVQLQSEQAERMKRN
eukprot:9306125-Pyramimonas_sp.AAC.1